MVFGVNFSEIDLPSSAMTGFVLGSLDFILRFLRSWTLHSQKLPL